MARRPTKRTPKAPVEAPRGRGRKSRRPARPAAIARTAPATAATPVTPSIDAFEQRLGYAFRDRARLEAAWVHRSAANERKLPASYERLEFLGDAVLGLLACDWLYRGHPDLPEGELSRLKSALVSAEALAGYARELGIGDHLVLGQGELKSGGRDKPSLLADSLEAVIAAVYLDGGLRASRQVVERFLRAASRSFDVAANDAKSALQEEIQARGIEAPSYRVTEERGPDHAKTFTVDVLIEGEVAASGTGRSKKAAELAAARRALQGRSRDRGDVAGQG